MAAAVIAAVGLVSTQAVAEDAFERMLSEKTLRIGWIMSPPGSQKDPITQELKGYYIDIISFVLKQVNVEPEFIETQWSTFVAGLQAKQFDIVAAGTFASIPRAASVAFTSPIFYLGYDATVRAGDDRFKSLDDIDQEGVTVAVVQGTGGHEFVKRTFSKANIVALSTNDLSSSLIAVQSGRADVAVEDAWATRRYIQTHPELVSLFSNTPYNLQPIAWATRYEDRDLREFLNTALEWMRINGKIEEFVKQYPASGRYVLSPTYHAVE
ncbi:substrate-binding periplasmic protein [Acuticoccus mangrovi]|uniref:Amino acid ABC transporter substrate-binding protein n=1 Tax=Acuticoccus mangrovi TaxID=2796142 RepID=A0A934MHU6_9HYPH|nr:amino acid ABC transporter substrate-binding protein [Acuticoccus mangrovi]